MPILYDPSRFQYTPLGSGWQTNVQTAPWWKNLLKGTGVFFLNSLTNTVNASQGTNPYTPQNQQTLQILPLAVFAFILILLFKKR